MSKSILQWSKLTVLQYVHICPIGLDTKRHQMKSKKVKKRTKALVKFLRKWLRQPSSKQPLKKYKKNRLKTRYNKKTLLFRRSTSLLWVSKLVREKYFLIRYFQIKVCYCILKTIKEYGSRKNMDILSKFLRKIGDLIIWFSKTLFLNRKFSL